MIRTNYKPAAPFMVLVLAQTCPGCLFGQGARPETVVFAPARSERVFVPGATKVHIQKPRGHQLQGERMRFDRDLYLHGRKHGQPAYDAMCTREGGVTAPQPTSGSSSNSVQK